MAMVRQLKLNSSHSRPPLYGDDYAADAIVMRMKKARFDDMT
jgi:hypothetical protein